MSSWRMGTVKQYKVHHKKWSKFCLENGINANCATVEQGIEFLTSLYRNGLTYSSINAARSALSIIIRDSQGTSFGQHYLVKRFMKGVFENRPYFPRTTTVWSVSQVLGYLEALGGADNLSLKLLTLRLTFLLCLLAGQRVQTIHALTLDDMSLNDSVCIFSVNHILKTTKPGIYLKPIRYLAFPENKDLCVINNLTRYLAKTQLLRKECRQLLISTVKPFRAVSRSTISRWCKDVLSNAGIDTEQIGAHSIRSAATSYARFKGLPLSVILNAAGWTRETTFERYYHKTIDNRDDLNFGQFILST